MTPSTDRVCHAGALLDVGCDIVDCTVAGHLAVTFFRDLEAECHVDYSESVMIVLPGAPR